MKNFKSASTVFFLIIIALIVLLALTYYYYQNKLSSQNLYQRGGINSNTNTQMSPAGPNARRRGGEQIMLKQGDNLKTSPVFQYAFQIFPGDLSENAKQALTGFNVKAEVQSDGSTLVTLTPKDSENQSQQYSIKPGQVLYYIEQTAADDNTDQDKDLNYRDDYGIVTDQNGIIQ